MDKEINKMKDIGILLDVFFNQLWAFSEYLNESEGRVETYRYANFVINTLKEQLLHLCKKNEWDSSKLRNHEVDANL